MNPYDDSFFDVFPIIFVIFFCIVGGIILFVFIKGAADWGKNNNSPKITVAAHVKTKRTNTSGGSGDMSATTSYYVTFEYESGDRQEFQTTGEQYGMLAEGDIGKLNFQGTRYLGFERVPS
ncbi:DUF2500 domain-containing protein [Sporosarcina sp. A2]|uniref:DUF2500 domain-containing protein n=1 Tax=Sporosarcina sp. A2 TaxID=3393449 RepID=UPI003D79D95F